MNEGIIKDAYEAIIKEIQTLFTISYVIAVGIGMLFNYQKYSEFGINIFDYSDVFDFLIAPFSDFKILLFSVLSSALIFLLIRLDMYWKKRHPESYSKANMGLDKKSWFDALRYIIFVLSFVLYLYSAADFYGKVVKVEVENQEPISVRFIDNEVKKGKLIGKTNNIIFLLKNEKVEAIPISALVKEIEIK